MSDEEGERDAEDATAAERDRDADLDPERYYDEFGEGEWERLDRDPVTRMEFENTTDYLAEYLPEAEARAAEAARDDAADADPVRVLDAGGAAGRYACWLAERGYDVTLVDLSAAQVELAREKAAERGVAERVTAERGDVRDLRFADDAFDAVCCLGGPLSHVVDDDERATAMAELRRVAVPGAPVFVSVIGRFAMLRDILKFTLDDSHGLLAPVAADGDYTAERVAQLADGEGWAECHGFRADEFERELEAAGFVVEKLVGLENVAARMKRELADADDEAVESVREVVRMLREDRTAADCSEHMLAVCRVE
ncbi:class I SAM-dependent methyltransferase [Halorussus gelatinilyticus]|uniref:Class I SAM-dependent methyltransferase n=1 Tax=Halorussus gelatinilyticus TaxID=2937524 RepID=A0A8U0IJ38_9EURY|nr:class I SAM-dependent methyltransferase [Halorussus gelatinilyticus]UPW00681.1 class I SAM-dependent methyltransferase [Halorussus gelatinilyticus]